MMHAAATNTDNRPAPVGGGKKKSERLWSAAFILFTFLYLQRDIFFSHSPSNSRRADSILVTGRVHYKDAMMVKTAEPAPVGTGSKLPSRGAVPVDSEEQSRVENPSDDVVYYQVGTNNTMAGDPSYTSTGGDEDKEHNKITLHLIGERHSGTTWMSHHLSKCFPDFWIDNRFTRFKHWFQDDEDGLYNSKIGEKVVVVAQFRNVYTWTESMRRLPYHSIEHYHLEWREFVTKPWTMPRTGQDLPFEGATANDFSDEYNGNNTKTKPDARICKRRYAPFEVIPCLEGDVDLYSKRGVRTKAAYELKRDGSGEPYANLLALRTAKIVNFLSVEGFERVQAFNSVRYEDLVLQGTESLIRKLEKQLHTTAKCVPDPSKELSTRPMEPEYMAYMRENVDWNAEGLVGYSVNDIF